MADRRIAIYLLLIGSLLLGLFTGRPFFFNLAYLFGALLIGSLIWSWFAINRMRINRQTRTRRAQVGGVLDEQFFVQNNSILPKLWLEIRDHSTLPGHAASRVVPALMPGGVYSWTVRTVCAVRGEFTLGPISIASGDPFGLFLTTRHIAATSSVLIFPAIVPLHDFASLSGVLSGGDAQRQRAPFVTTNAAGIREYAPGDSLNRVHWRSTIRRDRMMVKEFELDPLADVWMFLDLSASAVFERPYTISGTEPVGFIPPSSLEYGVVVASSLADYFLTKDHTLGFVGYCPDRVLLQPDRGYRQLTRILEMLALARSQVEVDFAELLAAEGHLMVRRTTAILITADPSSEWMDEAHMLVRRGLRVIAILLDPFSFGGQYSVDSQVEALVTGHITTYVVHNGDDLSMALANPI